MNIRELIGRIGNRIMGTRTGIPYYVPSQPAKTPKINKIYISLPISGQEGYARVKATRLEQKLKGKGFRVVNPFKVYAGDYPGYFDHICSDLLALSDCDTILLCTGWQESKGCIVEEHFARTYGIQRVAEHSLFPDEA